MVSWTGNRIPPKPPEDRAGPLVSIAIDIQSDGAMMSIVTKADTDSLSIVEDNVLETQVALLRDIAAGIGAALKI